MLTSLISSVAGAVERLADLVDNFAESARQRERDRLVRRAEDAEDAEAAVQRIRRARRARRGIADSGVQSDPANRDTN